MQFKIEQGIEIPERRGRSKLYPFSQMNIGDSFFIPGKTSQSISTNFGHHKPMKFSARTMEENGVKGVRVWRVA